MNKKSIYLFICLFFVACSAVVAQVQVKTGKPLQVTSDDSWETVTFEDDKIGSYSYSYQLHFMKKTGLACHYVLKVKNETQLSIQGNIYLKYYDGLVKRNIREQHPYKLKPNSTTSFKLIVQGCAKKNGQEEQEACLDCGAEFDWTTTKVK